MVGIARKNAFRRPKYEHETSCQTSAEVARRLTNRQKKRSSLVFSDTNGRISWHISKSDDLTITEKSEMKYPDSWYETDSPRRDLRHDQIPVPGPDACSVSKACRGLSVLSEGEKVFSQEHGHCSVLNRGVPNSPSFQQNIICKLNALRTVTGIRSEMQREPAHGCHKETLFSAVEIQTKDDSIWEAIQPATDQREANRVLGSLWPNLKANDFSNQHACKILMGRLIGENAYVTKQRILGPGKEHKYMCRSFAPYQINKYQIRELNLNHVCLSESIPRHLLDDLFAGVAANRLEVENVSSAYEEEEKNDLCLDENEPFYKNQFFFEVGDPFPGPIIFQNVCLLALESAMTHHSQYGEGLNVELILKSKTLDSAVDGKRPIISADTVPGFHINFCVSSEKKGDARRVVPSGRIRGKKPTGRETEQQSTQANLAATDDSNNGGALVCVGSSGNGGDGSGGDGRKGGGGDKKTFDQPVGPREKSKELLQLYEWAWQLLKAFCCYLCRHSPQDEDQLCMLLPAAVLGYESVICSQGECPGQNFTYDNVVVLHVDGLQSALLHLFRLLLEDCEDIPTLEDAIAQIHNCFVCPICYDNYLYSINPLAVCPCTRAICPSCHDQWESGTCPYCRELLASNEVTVYWPICIYEALNGRAPEEPKVLNSPSTNIMHLVRGPPAEDYVPFLPEHEEIDENDLDIYDYLRTSQEASHHRPQRLYSGHDIDTLATVFQELNTIEEETESHGATATHRPVNQEQPSDQLPDEVSDDGLLDFQSRFQEQNQQLQCATPGGDFEQFVRDNRNSLVYQRHLLESGDIMNNYASHEVLPSMQENENHAAAELEPASVNIQPQCQLEGATEEMAAVGAHSAEEEENEADVPQNKEDDVGLSTVTSGEFEEVQYETAYTNRNPYRVMEVASADSVLDAATEGMPSRRKQTEHL